MTRALYRPMKTLRGIPIDTRVYIAYLVFASPPRVRASRLSLLAFSFSLFFQRVVASSRSRREREKLISNDTCSVTWKHFGNKSRLFVEKFSGQQTRNFANHEFRGYYVARILSRGIPCHEREGGDCGKVERKCLGAELPCSSVSIVLSARTAIRLISQDPAGNLCTLVQGLEQDERGTTLENFIVSDEYWRESWRSG